MSAPKLAILANIKALGSTIYGLAARVNRLDVRLKKLGK